MSQTSDRRRSVTRPALVFCMPLRGHFHRLRPLIAGLVEAGVPTHVFTDRVFAADVTRAGATFVDLFAGRPIEAVDATSMPVPCRYVSFAGHYADAVTREAAALRPGLVIHDTFAVIGWAVANHLGVPRVNVCAAHNSAPAPTLARLATDPRVAISPICLAAARILRERHGIPDAGPFSYITGVSPDLNVYCEPPQFLAPADRVPFEPLVFFGSLPAGELDSTPSGASPFAAEDAPERLYVSFGTVIWYYYATEALAALTAIAEAAAARPDLTALISLGGGDRASLVAGLTRHNVRVAEYVDQLRVLHDASAFITHQGLNSTHESVARQVPMLSSPIFGDQPRMAARCQELGLALPLAATPRAPISVGQVHDALDALATRRGDLQARLAIARRWEEDVIAERPAALARILSLLEGAAAPAAPVGGNPSD